MINPLSGNHLQQSISIRPHNRAARVVFLVPVEESQESHWILDGIFAESYSRWAGTKSLIIPFDDGSPLDPKYFDWLKFVDPEFIYSFVDLSDSMIEQINHLALPIEIIQHKKIEQPSRWRDFVPSWSYGFAPVPSISTIGSPQANYPGWSTTRTPKLYITQHYEHDESRWLPDNFGVAHHTHVSTYGRDNLFETISYCSSDVPENNDVGDYRTDSLVELTSKIARRRVRTFSRLASIHSDGVTHPITPSWSQSFQIFIGDSINDRLNFWNSRLLTDDNLNHDLNSLIISPSLLETEGFYEALGLLLNNHNYQRSSGSPAKTEIRSYSIPEEECGKICSRLQESTYTSVSVSDDKIALALPDYSAIENSFASLGSTCHPIKVHDKSHTFIAQPPKHFDYLPPEHLSLQEGQWAMF